ncbi:hypothetical protein BIV60_08810 [Bacillus sp. MUM 116]|uniref:FUSC family protein n=1 Tax=Bacillus sp. MUM 116 TaxID=1678002 RepID=UPI0008F5CF0C|nr:FUSC family protein [Bacillus sp. MUM 116]OIK15633.1 hypothetical protein BIV60_08810 [Bacillus sp. MUM 116]
MGNPLFEHKQNKSLLIWKMAVASAISWQIATLLGSHHPYFAPISVILCLQSTINRSIRFSYHRMAGTIIGISVTVLAAPFINVSSWTIGILILIGCFIAKWLKSDETAIHQVALTILLVFVVGQKAGDYPIDRFRDTLIGAIIAVLIHMLVYPPNFTRQVQKNLTQLSEHLIEIFTNISEWIFQGPDLKAGSLIETEIKQLLEELHQSKQMIQNAQESLKYNPYAGKSLRELHQYQLQIQFLTKGYSYLANSVEILMKWASSGSMSALDQELWAEQVKAFIPLFKENPAEPGPPGDFLIVSIPNELEKHQYMAALYYETKVLLKDS